MLVFNAIVLASAVAIFVFIFNRELKDHEYSSVTEWEGQVDMLTIHKTNPEASYSSATENYNYGRYRRPIREMNLHPLALAQQIGQKKEFVWTAVTDGEWLLGTALLQFGYTSGAIVYGYNAKKNESFTTHLEAPLVSFLGAKFTPTGISSALNGCATWNFNGLNANLCANESTSMFDVNLKGVTKESGSPYEIEFSYPTTDEAMGLVFPLGPKRASVVTKFGGVAASAQLKIGKGLEASITRLNFPLAMMDYTRGLLRRITLWHWAAVSWTDDVSGKRLGMQLSEGTYDTSANISLESTLWVDGFAHHINSRVVYAQLDKSVPPQNSIWTVRTDDSRVDLKFTPAGVIVGDFHYGILDGNLYHIWGAYSGRVTFVNSEGSEQMYFLASLPGVLEDHYAKW